MEEETMLVWKIGDVTITRLVEQEFPVTYSEKHPFMPDARPEALAAIPWLYPDFVTAEGHLRLSIHALLVDSPGLRLVVDTCVGNDRPRRMLGGRSLSSAFLQHLTDTGWSRQSVDVVVCTHLHVDHVGWNTMMQDGHWVPTFPNARYLIGREEFEHWRTVDDGEHPAILADSIKPIFDAGLAELVEMDHRLSQEIHLKPTPGHTPGHVSVIIESQGETAIISGDAIHHPCQMAHPDWTLPFDSDPEAAVATRVALLEEVADQPILLIGTHFAAPTAGHVRRDGEAFRLYG
jgi:glyoxylase-like metal-dependent hydrolase (beta-lactamase superfamily II)